MTYRALASGLRSSYVNVNLKFVSEQHKREAG